MAFKIILFAAFLAIVNAGNVAIAPAPLAAAPLAAAPLATAIHATPIARVAAPLLAQRLAPAPLLQAAPIARLASAPAIAVAPAAKAVVADADFDPNPQYSYAYDIQDALTGDSKNHIESRNGDVVQGSYSLVDPDGTRRIVEYIADPINGFNAVVHREPLAVKAIAAAPVAKIATPVAAPLAYAAPIAPIAKVATPIAYSAPIAKLAPAPLAFGKAIIH